jgi:two-component system, NtrC family, response regulator
MANIVVFESIPDLSSEILNISHGTPHAISRAFSAEDIFQEDKNIRTDLFILNQTDNFPVIHLFKKITSCHTHPKVLVVADKPDISELKQVLSEGALDYIPRSNAIEHLRGLLERLTPQPNAEEPSWAEVGKRFNIFGNCMRMRDCLRTVAQASNSDVSFLIQGETGTGKELFARAIHGLSKRSNENLIVVDCASLPATLVESILFGYSKGAFTGASSESKGLVMRAHKGTLFLDEVSELPLELQKKFLRVLQERRFRPVGGKHEVESDFRLVAATNKDLSQMVKDGLFRADLLYRIRSLKLELPPLRQRQEDLPVLASELIRKSCEKSRIPVKSCSQEFLEHLSRHDWPGNVRELENVLDSVVAISYTQDAIYPEQLPSYIRVKAAERTMGHNAPAGIEPQTPPSHTFPNHPLPTYKKYRIDVLESLEKEYFRELQRTTDGDIAAAMQMANLSRARLYEFYKRYNLTKSGNKEAPLQE